MQFFAQIDGFLRLFTVFVEGKFLEKISGWV
jgi:hypothetical protein